MLTVLLGKTAATPAQPCAAVAPNDRAFLYGDGCFSTLRLRHGVLGLWPYHLQRLRDCCAQLGLQVDLNLLRLQVQQQAQVWQHGTIKIIISRGVGARGYAPPKQTADVYLQYFALPPDPQAPATDTLWLSDDIHSGVLATRLGLVMPQLAGLKTLNRLEQIIAKQSLAQTDWPEALLCNVLGQVIEGVQSNCFMRIAGQWCTPCLAQSGIAGVARAAILDRCAARGLACAVRPIDQTEIEQIEALFFCNALSGVVPVSRLNGRKLDADAVQDWCDLLF